jgi:hypothetical protein
VRPKLSNFSCFFFFLYFTWPFSQTQHCFKMKFKKCFLFSNYFFSKIFFLVNLEILLPKKKKRFSKLLVPSISLQKVFCLPEMSINSAPLST